jgi:hypothetical protein
LSKNTPERFHIVAFFSLHLRDRQWVRSWQERQFSVGRPNALTPKRHATEETFDENAAHHLPEVNNASVKNERHVAAARARWARSRVEAEPPCVIITACLVTQLCLLNQQGCRFVTRHGVSNAHLISGQVLRARCFLKLLP